MVTLNDAIRNLKKIHPELIVTAAANYKKDCYLLNAVKDPSKIDYNDPFYLVSKKNGAVVPFVPTEDLDGFLDAINNHEIKIK